ncbi:Protein kinase domain [Sesbania bispinosa]|nr:Protein kinase domain [Sesbania bispinosa]
MHVGNELGAGKPYKAKLEDMIALGCAFLMGFINVTWIMILNKKEQERNLLNYLFTSKNYSCSLKKDSIMMQCLRSPKTIASESGTNRSVLKREQGILSIFKCPQIVAYQGCDITFENGAYWFNLFMEYAPRGMLTDAVRKHNGGMEETMVGSHAPQIMLGLNYHHEEK